MYKLKLEYDDKKKEKFIKVLAYIGAGLDYLFNPVRWGRMIKRDYEKYLRVADQEFMQIIDGYDSLEAFRDACALDGIREKINEKLDSEETVMKVYNMLLEDKE